MDPHVMQRFTLRRRRGRGGREKKEGPKKKKRGKKREKNSTLQNAPTHAPSPLDSHENHTGGPGRQQQHPIIMLTASSLRMSFAQTSARWRLLSREGMERRRVWFPHPLPLHSHLLAFLFFLTPLPRHPSSGLRACLSRLPYEAGDARTATHNVVKARAPRPGRWESMSRECIGRGDCDE